MICEKCNKEITIKKFYAIAKEGSCLNMFPSEFEDAGYELEIEKVICPFCEDEEHNFVENLTPKEWEQIENKYRGELEFDGIYDN